MINLTDLQKIYKDDFKNYLGFNKKQLFLFYMLRIHFRSGDIDPEKIRFDYNHGFRVYFTYSNLPPKINRPVVMKFDKGFPLLGVLSLVSTMFTKQEELEKMMKNNRQLLWEYIYNE